MRGDSGTRLPRIRPHLATCLRQGIEGVGASDPRPPRTAGTFVCPRAPARRPCVSLSVFPSLCLPPPAVARCLPSLLGARALSRAPGPASRLVATYRHTLPQFRKGGHTFPYPKSTLKGERSRRPEMQKTFSVRVRNMRSTILHARAGGRQGQDKGSWERLVPLCNTLFTNGQRGKARTGSTARGQTSLTARTSTGCAG